MKAEEDREGGFRRKNGRSVPQPQQSPHLEVFHLFVELFLAWRDAKR